jgi:hypothetical protein
MLSGEERKKPEGKGFLLEYSRTHSE